MTDRQYEDLLQRILLTGDEKSDRTGTGTYSIFGAQLRYPLYPRFPLITTKKVHWHSVRTELLWMLRGDTNIWWLQEHGVTIWDEWADANGDLGPVYGSQWRAWPTPHGNYIDQLQNVIDQIKLDPDSRRLIVTAWNPYEISAMALPPCHMMFQFYVSGGKLSCQVYQRSCDMFLGVPFNIASYALLTILVAQECGLMPGELIWTGGDCHIYSNHVQQVLTQIRREPYEFPRFHFDNVSPVKDIFSYEPEDLVIRDYQHHPAIKADVAV